MACQPGLHLRIKFGEPLSEGSPNGQERGNDHHEISAASEFANPPFEIPGGDSSEIVTKVPKETTDFVLQIEKLRPQQLARSEDCANALADKRFNVDLLIQSDTHHLRDTTCIMTIGLVELRRECGLHMTRLYADDRQSGGCQASIEVL